MIYKNENNTLVNVGGGRLYLHDMSLRIPTISELQIALGVNSDIYDEPTTNATKFKMGIIRYGINNEWQTLWNDDLNVFEIQSDYNEETIDQKRVYFYGLSPVKDPITSMYGLSSLCVNEKLIPVPRIDSYDKNYRTDIWWFIGGNMFLHISPDGGHRKYGLDVFNTCEEIILHFKDKMNLNLYDTVTEWK